MTNYFIGWDVGAWKCGKGKNDSCDAIVVMDESGVIGFHRGTLGRTLDLLLDSPSDERPACLIDQWFSKCTGEAKDKRYSPDSKYYVAIDTPLGWPKDFRKLLDGGVPEAWSYQSTSANIENPLLYRYTEREKLKSGLSVIVDSIGSQSTKGMLLLQLLSAKDDEWGVWDAGNLTLIETYPKACLMRDGFVGWMSGLKLNQDLAEAFKVQATKKGEKPKTYRTETVIAEDVFDAVVCACIAKAFASKSPKLVVPTKSDPKDYKAEGWIFYPDQEESVSTQRIADRHMKVTSCEGIRTFAHALEAFQKHVKTKLENRKG